ncbi:MAG: PorV/PorQ family protein [Candidatus Marinimicrobia bacterium]|nr:PorV/PorQ family protein [Candidatus Neomarinimicrobiota bacterium]
MSILNKNKLLQIFSIFLILAILSSSTFALDLLPSMGGQRAGTSIFNFLKIGLGTRTTAMGNSGVNLSDDASVMYWNPAGVAQVGKTTLTLEQTQWFADIDYSYLGYIQKVNKNIYLGLSSGALYTDPMEVTTPYHPYGNGEYFSYGDMFIGLTFSQKMTDRFSYGATVKYVQENLDNLVMDGFLMDLGTYYWTGFKSLKFCVSLVNFGTQARPEGSYEKPLQEGGTETKKYALFAPPTEFRIGAAMNVIENDFSKTLVSLQLNHPVDNHENFVIGIEENIFDKFFLRTGWQGGKTQRSLTFGGGIDLNIWDYAFQADYAWADFGVLGDIQKFQITIELK